MENLSFHLQGIVREKDSQQDFEGPLSLILLLLQKNRIEIRDLRVSAGAGFVVAYTGDIMTMPGLPKVPAANNIDCDNKGNIYGLY